MNYFDIFTLTQQAGVEEPSLFPFPFKMHLVFAVFATIFFVYRFFVKSRPFQLIMAVAIPASLLIWLSESKTIFYAVGIGEAVLILAALVTSIIFKAPDEDAENAEEDEDSENADDEENNDDTDNKDESESEADKENAETSSDDAEQTEEQA